MRSVSVIIPAFNDSAGVAACLDALDRQTLTPDRLEVIVVDNGSAPPLHITSSHCFSLRVVTCATPGSYAARNAGAAIAKGDVLAFTDADCRPDARWLERGLASLDETGGSTVIGGDVLLDRPPRPTAVAQYQCITGFGQESNVTNRGFAATANLFCTRARFNDVGPFDDRLLSGGDLEWCRRAAARGLDIRYAPDVIVHTSPRSTLRGAIRQARRVVSGRAALARLGLAHVGSAVVARQRSPWQSARWILSQANPSLWSRLRVLAVAVAIRLAAAFERIRLAFGADAERR